MKPSSSTSDTGGLFGAVLGRGAAAAHTLDGSVLRAMLDVEAALAQAHAAVGSVPAAVAAQVAEACSGDYDVEAIGAAAAASGNPMVPLVAAIGRRLPASVTPHLHRGATSQDILDTAWMLVARRAIAAMDEDLAAIGATLAKLAARHRDDVMTGRTLLQAATPTTFGLVAATWLHGADGARARLRRTSLPVQLGGAVGTLAAAGVDDERAAALLAAFAAQLGQAVPPLAWHTMRLPVADLAGALGTAAGVAGTIAHDVVLLAQTEVGELREVAAGRGGSSTMPHKANPVAAIAARAGSLRAPALVASLFAGLGGEHQRAAGHWHAEWLTLRDLLRCTGSALSWLRECLDTLEVDTGRMRAGVDPASDAERLAGLLAPHLGRATAHAVVADATATARTTHRRLADVLIEDPRAADHLDPAEVRADTPDAGHAGLFIDRALAAHIELLQELP